MRIIGIRQSDGTETKLPVAISVSEVHSAYMHAKDAGFEGTEDEFAEALGKLTISGNIKVEHVAVDTEVHPEEREGDLKEVLLHHKESIATNTIKIAENSTSIEDIQNYITNNDAYILGVEVDFVNSITTRLFGAIGLAPGKDFDSFYMYGGRMRCNVLDDGTIKCFYGDKDYKEDGSNGQVMVYQPKFYYQIVPLTYSNKGTSKILDKVRYTISERPRAGFKLHPAFYDVNGKEVDYILYSAYEASLFDGANYLKEDSTSYSIDYNKHKLGSIAGVQPKCSITKYNFERLAQNRGSNWHIEHIQAMSANQLLMIIEYGKFELQSAIGKGVTALEWGNSSVYTGATSDLGNVTGRASSSKSVSTNKQFTADGKTSISYRGIENPWGNVLKFVEGINLCGSSIHILKDKKNWGNKFSEDNYQNTGLYVPTTSGEKLFIKKLNYVEQYDWLFMPGEFGGSTAYPIGDAWLNYGNPLVSTFISGGSYLTDNSGTPFGGPFFMCSNDDITGNYSAASTGTRLIYIPDSN